MRSPSHALVTSLLATTVLSGVGVVWGIVSGSQMILLDGVYGVVGVGVSALLIRAWRVSEQEPTPEYPYGREAATPLAIGIQGMVLTATLLYALVEAALTINAGGSDVRAAAGIVYGVIAFVASVAVWLWLRRRGLGSDLVAAEASAWRVGVWRGAGMIVGFALIGLLDGSSRSAAAPYIDPLMVIITCLAVVRTPVGMMRRSLVELLEGAPPARLQQEVMAAVDEVRGRFELDTPRVRMTKSGPKLYVEVDVLASSATTIGEEDEVRAALRDLLRPLPYELWLNVELSADPSWGA